MRLHPSTFLSPSHRLPCLSFYSYPLYQLRIDRTTSISRSNPTVFCYLRCNCLASLSLFDLECTLDHPQTNYSIRKSSPSNLRCPAIPPSLIPRASVSWNWTSLCPAQWLDPHRGALCHGISTGGVGQSDRDKPGWRDGEQLQM